MAGRITLKISVKAREPFGDNNIIMTIPFSYVMLYQMLVTNILVKAHLRKEMVQELTVL
jgi:hypothetical protein